MDDNHNDSTTRRPRRSRRREIAEMLEEEITRGEAAPGTPLQADALAQRFRTSIQTARGAIALLAERGRVIRQGRKRPPIVVGKGVRRALSAQEIAEVLEREITRGKWAPGTPLNTAALAQRFRTDVQTVRRAIALLAEHERVIRQGPRRPPVVAGDGVRRALSTREIVDVLARQIERRQRAAGTPLHTTALSELFGTNVETVQRAIVLLADRGLIERQGPGRPPLVAETPPRSEP